MLFPFVFIHVCVHVHVRTFDMRCRVGSCTCNEPMTSKLFLFSCTYLTYCRAWIIVTIMYPNFWHEEMLLRCVTVWAESWRLKSVYCRCFFVVQLRPASSAAWYPATNSRAWCCACSCPPVSRNYSCSESSQPASPRHATPAPGGAHHAIAPRAWPPHHPHSSAASLLCSSAAARATLSS